MNENECSAVAEHTPDEVCSMCGWRPAREPASALSPIIVSRHPGAVQWLAQQGIAGFVIAHATAEDIAGRVVYGNLPLSLAALASEVCTIAMPALRPDQRGKDLTPADMDDAGATLERYIVQRIE